MFWMAILMALPLLGLALFWVFPWRMALIPYIVLVAVSLFFDSLMMRAMRTPVQGRFRDMIGSTAVVHNWHVNQGRVVWRDEFWRARSSEGRRLLSGDRVVIESVSGLTLTVRPFSPEPHVNKSHAE